MRRFFILLFFVVAVCLAQTSEARKLALLVGVDEYDNVSSLKCCVNDMNTLKEALMKIEFEEDDIQMLVTGGAFKNMPTKKKIEQRISDLLSKAKPDDMVFIALSGHGAQEGESVYFCPPDVEVEDLEGTCVSINKIMDDLAKCNAKFKWMVVDACRNDPTQGPKGIGGKGMQVIPTPPAGIALFQSCAEGEESWEDLESGNGFFTKNLAVALSGEADSDNDGCLTLMEVCKWTTAKTKEQVEKSKNKTQRPYFSGTISDFTLIENQDVLIATNLVNEAQAATKAGNYFLAIEKYNKALEICPNNAQWKHELELAKRLTNNPQNPTSPDPMKIEVPKDFTTIEEAYKNVKDGGSITIQPGKYELSKTLVVDRPVTFRGSTGRPEDVAIACPSADAIKITGGSPSFQNLTVISEGEKCKTFYVTDGKPKLYRCIIISRKWDGMDVEGEKADPQVDSCFFKNCGGNGVAIFKGGRGNFSDCDFSGNVCPGVGVGDSGNPTFTGCKVHDGKQGSVYVCESALGTFTNCEFYGDQVAGALVDSSANPTFNKCLIHDNKRVGVGVFNKGQGKFSECEIYGNAVSGVDVQKSGNPTVTGCKIHDNKQVGVGIVEEGLGKFTECEIYDNAASGIDVRLSGNPTVAKCVIHDNKQMGVSVTLRGLGKFSECEIFGNAFGGIAVGTFGNATVSGCKIHDNKQVGVGVFVDGMGTFNNNKVERHFFNGVPNNWFIHLEAGTVKGFGNTPSIPMP